MRCIEIIKIYDSIVKAHITETNECYCYEYDVNLIVDGADEMGEKSLIKKINNLIDTAEYEKLNEKLQEFLG